MKPRFLFTILICMSSCLLFNTTTVASTFPQADTNATAGSKGSLPVIGFGYGAMSFIGDVGQSYFNTPFLYRGGFQFDVQLHTRSNYEIFFHIFSGKVFGEEKTLNRNVNFMSNVFMAGANLRYSFNCKKYPKQVLIPFVSLGVETIAYNPYTDLQDADGVDYHYWNDGTIRNMAETSGDATQSKLIHRDYDYETNVRNANLDSLGKFKQYALAFPISIGVKFKLSERVALHFTETYHLTTTDFIDGITDKSIGSRAGKSGNDKILCSAVSFQYNLAAPRATPKPVSRKVDQAVYKNVNYESLQREDADGDGIPDFADLDNSTPAGAKVDANGKAIDSDGDGVPDYRDKEPASAPGILVDEHGVLINDSTQEAKFIRDSLDIEMMKIAERIKTKNEQAEGSKSGSKTTLPDEYKGVDTDRDGIISADEIAKAIELYTTGKSTFSKAAFYKLVDYFFAQ